jgi:hypothetical protein
LLSAQTKSQPSLALVRALETIGRDGQAEPNIAARTRPCACSFLVEADRVKRRMQPCWSMIGCETHPSKDDWPAAVDAEQPRRTAF